MINGVNRASPMVDIVIGGGTYEELAAWRDLLLERIAQNPGLTAVDHDYKETKPQLRVEIDRARAGDLGVSVENVGRTLETLLGSRRVTKLLMNGEEYDVILEALADTKRSANDVANIYVRSSTSDALIPLASLVRLEEFAADGTGPRIAVDRTARTTLRSSWSGGSGLLYVPVAEALPEARRAVFLHRHGPHVAQSAAVEVARGRVVPRVLVPPVLVGREGQHTGQEADDVVGLARGEERAVAAVMEDDEGPDQESAGQGLHREGQPEGHPEQPVGEVPQREEGDDAVGELPQAAPQLRALVGGHRLPPRGPGLLEHRAR